MSLWTAFTAILARVLPAAALVRLLLLALPALTCRPAPATAPEDPAAALAQLCGTWTAPGPQEGVVVQERWRRDAAGLIGDGLTFDAHGAPIASEALQIVLRGHHGSLYRAWPSGAANPTDFEQRISAGGPADPSTWTWQSPTNDFPRQIRYQLTAPDRLHVQIAGHDDQGRARALEWRFVRVQPCE